MPSRHYIHRPISDMAMYRLRAEYYDSTSCPDCERARDAIHTNSGRRSTALCTTCRQAFLAEEKEIGARKEKKRREWENREASRDFIRNRFSSLA